MTAQVTGLVTSLALYLAAAWLFLRVQRPEISEPVSSEGVRSVFSTPRKAEVSWLVGFVLAFAVLTATDFSVGFQLLFAGALALYCTVDEALRNAEEAGQLRLTRWAALFLVWLGYLGLACFGGGLLATPFD